MKFSAKFASALMCVIASGCVSSEKVSNAVELGAPCDVQTVTDVDTKGMQCYWYGDSSHRQAMWIIPDTSTLTPHPANYSIYTQDWETYTSPDASFTVQYPSTGFINDTNWEKFNVIDVLPEKPTGDIGVGIKIEKVLDNAVTVEMIIEDIIKNSSAAVRSDDFLINDTVVTRLDAAPKGSLAPRSVHIFVPRNGYYIKIVGERFGDPFFDLFTEAVISTITVKE